MNQNHVRDHDQVMKALSDVKAQLEHEKNERRKAEERHHDGMKMVAKKLVYVQSLCLSCGILQTPPMKCQLPMTNATEEHSSKTPP